MHIDVHAEVYIHLDSSYSLPSTFPDPAWTSMVAKLRVISTIAPDCYDKHRELEDAQLTHGKRPFPDWHKKCFFSVLAKCGEFQRERGISTHQVETIRAKKAGASFQSIAKDLIRKRLESIL